LRVGITERIVGKGKVRFKCQGLFKLLDGSVDFVQEIVHVADLGLHLKVSEDFQGGQLLEGVRFLNPFSASFDLQKWDLPDSRRTRWPSTVHAMGIPLVHLTSECNRAKLRRWRPLEWQ